LAKHLIVGGLALWYVYIWQTDPLLGPGPIEENGSMDSFIGFISVVLIRVVQSRLPEGVS